MRQVSAVLVHCLMVSQLGEMGGDEEGLAVRAGCGILDHAHGHAPGAWFLL